MVNHSWSIILPGMLIPIPPDSIDQVFLYISYYMTALISPANLLFYTTSLFYLLSYIFFMVCLIVIVSRSTIENKPVMTFLSVIPVLNIIPLIKLPDWPVGSIIIMIPSLVAIPINHFYVTHSEKFTDIYFDIFFIAVVIFIINWGWLWCNISYAIKKPKWVGIFMMIPVLNILTLLYLAFGSPTRRSIYRPPPGEY